VVFSSEGCYGGVPLEDMVRLANEAGVDPWFSVPYNADDNYIANMANLINQQLRPDLVGAPARVPDCVVVVVVVYASVCV
jgi:hypothetical protein